MLMDKQERKECGCIQNQIQSFYKPQSMTCVASRLHTETLRIKQRLTHNKCKTWKSVCTEVACNSLKELLCVFAKTFMKISNIYIAFLSLHVITKESETRVCTGWKSHGIWPTSGKLPAKFLKYLVLYWNFHGKVVKTPGIKK